MKVGDLVRHKSDGCYGTIMQVRKNHWQVEISLALVYWPQSGCNVLHAAGQLEIVCK